MDLDHRLLRSFVAIAREGSFTRAAARVRLTQPTLSLQMQRLEEWLGFPVFERTTRRVTLTREGEELLARAQPVVEGFEQIRQDVRRLRDRVSRELHVGSAFFTADIPERNALLEAFSAAEPQVKLTIHNAAQGEIIAAVGRGSLDCAIVLGASDTAYFSSGRSGRAGQFPAAWKALTLGSKPIGLLVPADSALADRDRIHCADLSEQDVALIDPTQAPAVLNPLLDKLRLAGARLVESYEAQHAFAVERFAARRQIACVSLGWFRPIEPSEGGPMAWRPFADYDGRTELALIDRSEAQRPLKDAFIAFAAGWIADRDRRATPTF